MKKALFFATCIFFSASAALACDMISDEEIYRMSDARLKVLDANQDGQLTRSEFFGGSAEKFAIGDANNDGILSRDEFRATKIREARGVTAALIKK